MTIECPWVFLHEATRRQATPPDTATAAIAGAEDGGTVTLTVTVENDAFGTLDFATVTMTAQEWADLKTAVDGA